MTASSRDQSLSPPCRFIYNDDDMEQFKNSSAREKLLRLTAAMGKSCASADYQYDPKNPLKGISPAMAALHGSLTAMLTWLLDYPPESRAQARFGNPMFRKWHERLVERSTSIVCTVLKMHQEYPGPQDYGSDILESASKQGKEATGLVKEFDSIPSEEDKIVVSELISYLQAAFGHPIRLDYGTGHESSFQVFLYCLCKLGCFGSTESEPPAMERLKGITLSIYHAYLTLTRQLQTDYMLEPAGSHGVWGLDDYHCLPFYFGACQLQADGGDYTPASIHEDSVLAREGDTFLYFGCIRYIKSLKKGVPFFEHSPMLNDISQLATWQKVATGLLRLYEGEVLDKRQGKSSSTHIWQAPGYWCLTCCYFMQ